MSGQALQNLIFNMLDASVVTLEVFALTLVFSLPLGLLFAAGRMSRCKWLSLPIGWLLLVVRGTPLILQLIFFYFVPPELLGIGLPRFWAAILAFSINYGAYFAEIFRGGIEAVDRGQIEAAKVLGYSKWQTTTKIVIPQMLKVCLPPVSNECITLVKDTALVTAIGVTEILYFAKASVNRDVNATAYLVAAAFYLLMTYGLTKLFQYLEKKYSY